jgi:predicted permease
MGKMGEMWRRVKMLVRRGEFDAALEEEIRAHREWKEREYREAGVSEQEARQRASREFGNATAWREKSHERWGWRWLEDLGKDLRFGARMLRKNPGFTVVAVLTLALGIGVNTAIFTLVHAVMLKALPVAHPEQLYTVGDNRDCCVEDGLQDNFTLFSQALYREFRDHTGEFEKLAAFQAGEMNFGVRRASGEKAAKPYVGELVSGNYFEMLGVRPYLGRAIDTEDDKANAAAVAMMSYHTWIRNFGSDPSVAGGSFFVNGLPVTVVGVAPPEFFGETLRSDPPDFWMPLASEPALRGEGSLLHHDETGWLYVMGRLRKGERPERAQAHLTTELQEWLAARPSLSADDRNALPKQKIALVSAKGGVTRTRSRYENGLLLLTGMSGLVLLIACSNIANMLLARGSAERQLNAVRTALGASRIRLLRQALTESVLLGTIGGAAGLAVAYVGTRMILVMAFRGAEYVPMEAAPSAAVLGFALGVSLATGIIFGIAPAWMAARANPIDALRGAGRSTRGRATLPGKSLVVLQAAMSLVLLVGAGLLTMSLRRLERQSFGFETRGRMIVKIDPEQAGYKPEQLEGLYRRIDEDMRRIPGVVNASLSLYSPMADDNWSFGLYIEGRKAPANPDDRPSASYDRVGPHYFETIGTKVLRGRGIDERDRPGARHAVVVNERLAKKYFPNQEPIGQHLGFGGAQHASDYEIVGIVEDAKYQDAYGPAYPTVFVPLFQGVKYEKQAMQSVETRANYFGDIELLIAGQPENLERAIRTTLGNIDGNLTVLKVQSLAEQVSLNFNSERLVSALTGLFGLLALVLACVGLYGVTAYGVAQRTSEIGIRMALGAGRARVVKMVVRGAMIQIGIGVAIGIPIALAGGHALANQLFGVNGYDPSVIGGAALMLGTAALAAGMVPAFRAASIDPMKALRAE